LVVLYHFKHFPQLKNFEVLCAYFNSLYPREYFILQIYIHKNEEKEWKYSIFTCE